MNSMQKFSKSLYSKFYQNGNSRKHIS